MRARRPLPRAIASAAAATAVAALLSGCALIEAATTGYELPPVRDAESQEVVESGQTHVLNVRIGDCLGGITDEDEIDQIDVVPCDEPHDYEVMHEFDLTGDAYPELEVIDEASLEECDAAFAEYVGVDWVDSVLDWYSVFPTETSWNEVGDRVVQCFVYDPTGPVTGSLEGAGI
ncbi:hypothetical protein ARHIZOSPH14_27710 [Agromyces rhizosphaerae]|uniref:Septum formation-related domain-containing protein n=1 Tax=Agromyces rhizosphaerae TaxID=88374 RepID=A0A9W6FPY8_9MICO|nr:septum formation family protein [Agromyces rhizosphaerae]GLI28529.1 hypothetical protein ARHIZOSPH14_27710 [Agromyces rhizosphaerae]